MKKRFLVSLCLLLGGGSTLKTPFSLPQGGLVTAISAPLSTELNGTTLTEDPIRTEQAFSFFWIPFIMPSVAISEKNNHPKTEEFTDYDYFSIFGGLFSSVTLRHYGKE